MTRGNKLKSLFICLMLILFGIAEVGYALNYVLNTNVVSGYKQVTSVGGTNSTNTVGKQDGVTVSKTIEETEVENYFDITLEVQTEKTVNEIVKSEELAIVFVLDRSYTMKDNSRWTKAVQAVVEISTSLSSYDNVKMAAVGFSGGKAQSREKPWNDTVDLRASFSNAAFTTQELGNYDTDSYYAGGTNIHGGLLRAYQLLATQPSTTHKKIILLSDGVPTFYYDANGYTKGSGNSDTQEKMKEVPNCKDAAVNMATTIKSYGIEIYTIGYELDKLTHEFKINGVVHNERQIAINTLTEIASPGNFKSADTTGSIIAEFRKILQEIKEYIETKIETAWAVEDPLNENSSIQNFEFVGFYDDLGNLQDKLDYKNKVTNHSSTAEFKNEKILWDIKSSKYTTKVVGNKTYYTFKVKYRVRLKNEISSFNSNTIYNTNGTTTMTYYINNNGVLSENKYINFLIPSVVGYLGNLSFIKKSTFDGSNLAGAKFKLSHDPNCTCYKQRKYATIQDIYVTSNTDGTVTFTNIPSGHKYILSETEAPNNYVLSNQKYNIEVSYGTVVGGPSNSTFNNDIKTTSLIVKKTVIGEATGKFNFNLVVNYQNKKVTGNYSYVITTSNGTKTGTIDLSNAQIQLGAGESIEIKGLPVNSTYSVTETTTEGYEVSYKLNSGTEKLGSTVTCNSKNNCNLKLNTKNEVEFINTAWYILPDTGSSKALILLIVGLTFIITPIIYIAYQLKTSRNN